MMKKALILSTICLFGAGVAFAASDFGQQREAAMKRIGHSAGVLAAIAKGKVKYDPAEVKAALTNISTTIKTFPSLFPTGSEHADRAASPKIWQAMDDFKAHADKLAADADTLASALPADRKGVAQALGTLGESCSACHQAYRQRG